MGGSCVRWVNRRAATLRGRGPRKRLPVRVYVVRVLVRGYLGYVGAVGIHSVNVEVTVPVAREGDPRAIGRPVRTYVPRRVA
jgi:hypothetical protein